MVCLGVGEGGQERNRKKKEEGEGEGMVNDNFPSSCVDV